MQTAPRRAPVTARRITPQEQIVAMALTSLRPPRPPARPPQTRSWVAIILVSSVVSGMTLTLVAEPWALLHTQAVSAPTWEASGSLSAIGGGAGPGVQVPASAGGPAPTPSPTTPAPTNAPTSAPTATVQPPDLSPAPESPWPPNPWNPTVDHPGVEWVSGCWGFSGSWGDAGGWCRWFGQCTWEAAELARDHHYLGLGNAGQWKWTAAQRGYRVGTTPVVGATVVFQPGVEGAGGAGHVAHVTHVYPDGWFEVEEMNFYWRGGGWGRVDWRYVHVTNGVQFIY